MDRVAVVLLSVLALGAAGAWLSGHDVVASVDIDVLGASPSLAHPLGTDGLGRDLLARLGLALGAVAPLALVAGALAIAAGLVVGTVEGLHDGPASALMRASLELAATLPAIVVVLVLAVATHGWLGAIPLGVAIALAPEAAGDVALVVRSLAARGVFAAGRTHGLSWVRLLGVHAWWGGCRHRLGARALDAAARVGLVEATLSYLGGFGIEEPAPSLGNMIAHALGSPSAGLQAWLAPGVALVGLVWSLDRLAQRVRSAAHAC